MSIRAYYSVSVEKFFLDSPEEIIGHLTKNHPQDLVNLQTSAWIQQIKILKDQLQNITDAYICFELLIPRMGKRADVVILHRGLIFVIEFKIGEKRFNSHDLRQTQSYALDLNCFHEASHNKLIVPILIATEATAILNTFSQSKFVFETIKGNRYNLRSLLDQCLAAVDPQPSFSANLWLTSSYKPTPTIIQAAQALYANHKVEDIAQNDAGAQNLSATSESLNDIINQARMLKKKCICFVTGVPGAGKTLVGLKIATDHNNAEKEDYAVFLSGNGPLVEVLREALARDKVSQASKFKKSDARRETDSFIQNIHHFRDEYLRDTANPPAEKVVIFDEAQRAWDRNSATQFMQQKRGAIDFDQSEPEFLIGVMDRHEDWCVIIALIGGGQEINRGEAGLNGWFEALATKFYEWNIFYSTNLKQREYAGSDVNLELLSGLSATPCSNLHLSTSMRSFRADMLSHWVHYFIHNQSSTAVNIANKIQPLYPIYVTRDLQLAKNWIKDRVRGLESSGLLASSGAKRLKSQGIFVGNVVTPADWFLNDPDDVRSSNFMEDTATEFVIQGLELDWCLVAWDADFRYCNGEFQHWKFSGSSWKKRNQREQQRYLENAYRVLLTRARQGMVIFVPTGDLSDSTRSPLFYDSTYSFLLACGAKVLNHTNNE